MSVRVRLLLSFTSVLMVTIMLFVLSAYLVTIAITGDVRSFSDFYKNHYKLHPLSASEERIFLELKSIAKTDPAKLMSAELLSDYDFQLRMIQAGMYVRKESKQLYVSPSLREPHLGAALPGYEMGNNQIRNTINDGNRFFAYAKFDFTFSDQDRGSIYVLRERSPFAEMIRKLFPIFIGVLLAVLLFTNWLLFRLITRSIIKPLNELRQSAEQIKSGDLHYEVKAQGQDEIGQLCRSFEEMRLQLKQSVQLQLQYEDNRKELLSSISHDLRTPITTIKGYVEGIRDGVADTPVKLNQYLETIHTRVTSLDRLVDELFLYSKLDLRKVPYSFEHVDLQSFLADALEELHFDLDLQGIQLEGVFPHSPLPVLIDREKLKRVILNLIDNGVKYMDKDAKQIIVRVTESDEYATVEVRDNGAGILQEQLPHIFDQFYRGLPPHHKQPEGSGLGLAIAKQIIEGHGGRIWAESEWKQGCSIYFTLKKTIETADGGDA
ncbi:HAMP domain-containing sensor histidine kinase [Paenibacillus sp. UMB4589-SE434]|uniref:sensor histidine kinase n=1 Tax=Paenibacillus sp. UMB4589-SE434 TaxID=3046314 RepID=UPI00255007BF|nr:HAMP domain-containing sensor histidine kinase [Paenibacillus sp. UMB4589-SE434]MDK8182364.1 HAMP domain-containing sensor histidine kinase [Paenibacillus sp. UMB4589-SE434]